MTSTNRLEKPSPSSAESGTAPNRNIFSTAITPALFTLPRLQRPFFTSVAVHGYRFSLLGRRRSHGTLAHFHRTLPHLHGTLAHFHGTLAHFHGTLAHFHGTLVHFHGTLAHFLLIFRDIFITPLAT